jgi:hypothetical protein
MIAAGNQATGSLSGAGEVEGLLVLREIQGTLVRIERALSERPDRG